jgi:phage terminase large subunit-like protein
MLELEIRKEMNVRGRFFQMEWLPSTMNKEAKIKSALQGRYSNASILHLKNWLNINELEAQLLKFPNWKHDDIVDATAMATMLLDSYRLYQKKQAVVTTDYSKYL